MSGAAGSGHASDKHRNRIPCRGTTCTNSMKNSCSSGSRPQNTRQPYWKQKTCLVAKSDTVAAARCSSARYREVAR